jgi:4-hydroxythreonine-4-phosphate dehydrogenase
MMLCADNFRVALVTEHVPVSAITQNISKEKFLANYKSSIKACKKILELINPRLPYWA